MWQEQPQNPGCPASPWDEIFFLVKLWSFSKVIDPLLKCLTRITIGENHLHLSVDEFLVHSWQEKAKITMAHPYLP